MRHSRDDTLAVLHGQRIGRLLVFSGLPSLTATGLRTAGVRFGEAHTDALKMAAAAASTFEMYAFESAVVPFDLCVEAEALGCEIDFQSDVDGWLAPVVSAPLERELRIAYRVSQMAVDGGRASVVADALRLLKQMVGREIVIGACIPGPFTLAWQLFGAEVWLSSLDDNSDVETVLAAISDLLARVAQQYHAAGADFITVHEMGGSPQVIGPNVFRKLVKPALQNLFARLPSPNVLSICGDTNVVVADMAACGASALSVDHRNDLARTRRLLGDDVVLFGNFDPVATLSNGTPADITRAVGAIADAGANAVWPGCDLWPEIPDENMRALLMTANVQR